MEWLQLVPPADSAVTSYSDSELSNLDVDIMESSLPRHSHFFCPPSPLPASARCRPLSVPLLLDNLPRILTASPMLTVLDGSSSERIDRDSTGTDVGEGDNTNGEREGIRYRLCEDLCH